MTNCSIFRFYKRHLTLSNVGISAGFSAILVGVLVHFGKQEVFIHMIANTHNAIYGALIALSSSLFGFVLTASTITVAFMESPPFKQVRDNEDLPSIFSIYRDACAILALSTVCSLVGLVIDNDTKHHIWFTYIAFGITTCSLLSMINVLWILGKVTDYYAAATIQPAKEKKKALEHDENILKLDKLQEDEDVIRIE